MNFSLCQDCSVSANSEFAAFYFYSDGNRLDSAPVCLLSLLGAGSMRFRWDETNPNRQRVFTIASVDNDQVVPLELIHSKTVYFVQASDALHDKRGDGILTCNEQLVPSITVADCMPIYLYDHKSGCFGVLHSGWKGTGIILEAFKLAREKCGSLPSDFSVVLGPHIHSCCYQVDRVRYEQFVEQFGVSAGLERDGRFYLSMLDANLSLLERAGVPSGNVCVITDCTCCSDTLLGSFRRQTARLAPSILLEERYLYFTPMAAWIGWGS